jgi:hypothetical protein
MTLYDFGYVLDMLKMHPVLDLAPEASIWGKSEGRSSGPIPVLDRGIQCAIFSVLPVQAPICHRVG